MPLWKLKTKFLVGKMPFFSDKYENIFVFINTLDHCQGYRFFKGLEIPTPTLTVHGPIPNPCGV